MNLLITFKFDVKKYVDMVDNYYTKFGRTTEIHIDTLIVLYKITHSDYVFNVIFKTHKALLMKIVTKTFNDYRRYLYPEDFYELKSMLFCEFYRRVMFYKIPPQAPFSKYIKLYLKNWMKSYTKLMVKKNNRETLIDNKDMIYDGSQFAYKDGIWQS